MPSNLENSRSRGTRTYQAPRLVRYGTIRELTATGTGTNAENQGQMVITRRA